MVASLLSLMYGNVTVAASVRCYYCCHGCGKLLAEEDDDDFVVGNAIVPVDDDGMRSGGGGHESRGGIRRGE